MICFTRKFVTSSLLNMDFIIITVIDVAKNFFENGDSS